MNAGVAAAGQTGRRHRAEKFKRPGFKK